MFTPPELLKNSTITVCSPLFCWWGVGGEPQTKFSKKGWGLARPQLSEGGCWEKGEQLFPGGGGVCNFYIKKKLKSEICNDKKLLSYF